MEGYDGYDQYIVSGKTKIKNLKRKYSVAKTNLDSSKNMLLLKNLQFLYPIIVKLCHKEVLMSTLLGQSFTIIGYKL